MSIFSSRYRIVVLAAAAAGIACAVLAAAFFRPQGTRTECRRVADAFAPWLSGASAVPGKAFPRYPDRIIELRKSRLSPVVGALESLSRELDDGRADTDRLAGNILSVWRERGWAGADFLAGKPAPEGYLYVMLREYLIEYYRYGFPEPDIQLVLALLRELQKRSGLESQFLDSLVALGGFALEIYDELDLVHSTNSLALDGRWPVKDFDRILSETAKLPAAQAQARWAALRSLYDELDLELLFLLNREQGSVYVADPVRAERVALQALDCLIKAGVCRRGEEEENKRRLIGFLLPLIVYAPERALKDPDDLPTWIELLGLLSLDEKGSRPALGVGRLAEGKLPVVWRRLGYSEKTGPRVALYLFNAYMRSQAHVLEIFGDAYPQVLEAAVDAVFVKTHVRSAPIDLSLGLDVEVFDVFARDVLTLRARAPLGQGCQGWIRLMYADEHDAGKVYGMGGTDGDGTVNMEFLKSRTLLVLLPDQTWLKLKSPGRERMFDAEPPIVFDRYDKHILTSRLVLFGQNRALARREKAVSEQMTRLGLFPAGRISRTVLIHDFDALAVADGVPAAGLAQTIAGGDGLGQKMRSQIWEVLGSYDQSAGLPQGKLRRVRREDVQRAEGIAASILDPAGGYPQCQSLTIGDGVRLSEIFVMISLPKQYLNRRHKSTDMRSQVRVMCLGLRLLGVTLDEKEIQGYEDNAGENINDTLDQICAAHAAQTRAVVESLTRQLGQLAGTMYFQGNIFDDALALRNLFVRTTPQGPVLVPVDYDGVLLNGVRLSVEDFVHEGLFPAQAAAVMEILSRPRVGVLENGGTLTPTGINFVRHCAKSWQDPNLPAQALKRLHLESVLPADDPEKVRNLLRVLASGLGDGLFESDSRAKLRKQRLWLRVTYSAMQDATWILGGLSRDKAAGWFYDGMKSASRLYAAAGDKTVEIDVVCAQGATASRLVRDDGAQPVGAGVSECLRIEIPADLFDAAMVDELVRPQLEGQLYEAGFTGEQAGALFERLKVHLLARLRLNDRQRAVLDGLMGLHLTDAPGPGLKDLRLEAAGRDLLLVAGDFLNREEIGILAEALRPDWGKAAGRGKALEKRVAAWMRVMLQSHYPDRVEFFDLLLRNVSLANLDPAWLADELGMESERDRGFAAALLAVAGYLRFASEMEIELGRKNSALVRPLAYLEKFFPMADRETRFQLSPRFEQDVAFSFIAIDADTEGLSMAERRNLLYEFCRAFLYRSMIFNQPVCRLDMTGAGGLAEKLAAYALGSNEMHAPYLLQWFIVMTGDDSYSNDQFREFLRVLVPMARALGLDAGFQVDLDRAA